MGFYWRYGYDLNIHFAWNWPDTGMLFNNIYGRDQ